MLLCMGMGWVGAPWDLGAELTQWNAPQGTGTQMVLWWQHRKWWNISMGLWPRWPGDCAIANFWWIRTCLNGWLNRPPLDRAWNLVILFQLLGEQNIPLCTDIGPSASKSCSAQYYSILSEYITKLATMKMLTFISHFPRLHLPSHFVGPPRCYLIDNCRKPAALFNRHITKIHTIKLYAHFPNMVYVGPPGSHQLLGVQ